MGLTNRSVGKYTKDNGFAFKKTAPSDRIIALAGNPNVGKSTVFNGLTGLHQHTGNWPGKTVSTAHGFLETETHRCILVDIPGTYSLLAHSAEESVARDFICFGNPDKVVVVCDATCLERNLNLVLQITEVTDNVIVCVNLMDEATRKHISVDTEKLSRKLRVPVIGITARNKQDLSALTKLIENAPSSSPFTVTYPTAVENAVKQLEPLLETVERDKKRRRWVALKMLENDSALVEQLVVVYGETILTAKALLDVDTLILKDAVASALVKKAASIAKNCVSYQSDPLKSRDLSIDRVLTGKKTAYPLMLVLLLCVFWITIVGANYPSALLSSCLFWVQDRLTELFTAANAPAWLHGALVLGVYRVLAWVISVMLPPMAIFFPLFTLLEDVGYLPRLAFALDKPFQKCDACGKQALTMCMGFGCNAAGVVGARIIDSPRERLLAILTNSFVPCNGRFPTLISILTMFFIGSAGGMLSSVWSATLLTALILLSVFATFVVTKLLSKTVLKGIPSSFTLELPPYRKPQIGKVIWRSLWDRTIFVLGRAVAVAAPAGLILWLTANITVGEVTLLRYCADILDPFARLLGLDGVILIAFVLGFPANEIVIPIIIMAYLSTGTLVDIGDLSTLKTLFIDNGWTPLTALNTMLFSLFHWPCSTTLATVKKETGSFKWTVFAALLPTALGILLCILTTAVSAFLTSVL